MKNAEREPSALQKAILPLFSHKIESDEAGKHHWWRKRAHSIAETAAVGTDVAALLGTIYIGTKSPPVALGTILLYHAAVQILPDPISKVANTILKKPTSQ